MEKKDREGGTEQQEFNQLLEEPSVKPFIIDTAELQSTYILLFPHFQHRQTVLLKTTSLFHYQ